MMNNDHLRTHPARETTGTRWMSHVDVLNSVMDPIDVLSEADLQNELSLYANAQFTFDTLPGVAVEDKPDSVSSFGIYQQPSSHFDTHHQHQQQQQKQQKQQKNQHPLSLDINGTIYNDAASSTVSSPYDQRQHSFSPLSSLPTSPTKLDKNDEHQADPLLSFMMLSADQQRAHHVNTFSPTNSVNDTNGKGEHQDTSSVLTLRKKSASTPRRRTQSTPGRQRQNDQHQPLLDDEIAITRPVQEDYHDNDGDNDHNDEDDIGGTDDDLVKLDKRRRNTAASARFRIKKKMREQSLQRTACEMTEKAKALENRVHELEREVKWLKDLIVAKNRP